MRLRNQKIAGLTKTVAVLDVFKRNRLWTGFIRFANRYIGVSRGQETAAWRMDPFAGAEVARLATKSYGRTRKTSPASPEFLEGLFGQTPQWVRKHIAIPRKKPKMEGKYEKQ